MEKIAISGVVAGMVFECITVTFTWIKTVPEILRLRSHTRSTRALVYVLFRDGTSHLSTPHLTLTVCWLSSTRNIAIHVRHTSYLPQASFKQLNLKHSALLLMNIVDLLVLLPKVRFFCSSYSRFLLTNLDMPAEWIRPIYPRSNVRLISFSADHYTLNSPLEPSLTSIFISRSIFDIRQDSAVRSIDSLTLYSSEASNVRFREPEGPQC